MRTFYKSDEPISQFAYPMNNHTKYYTRVLSKTKQKKEERSSGFIYIYSMQKFDTTV